MTLKLASLLVVLLCTACSREDKEIELSLVIRDHLFFPATLNIPAGRIAKVMVDNQDATPEEFDSKSLNREKVISAHSKTVLFIGPLTPGEYEFAGEFYAKTAQGKVVVK